MLLGSLEGLGLWKQCIDFGELKIYSLLIIYKVLLNFIYSLTYYLEGLGLWKQCIDFGKLKIDSILIIYKVLLNLIYELTNSLEGLGGHKEGCVKFDML
jgi:hypothetical protein